MRLGWAHATWKKKTRKSKIERRDDEQASKSCTIEMKVPWIRSILSVLHEHDRYHFLFLTALSLSLTDLLLNIT